MADPTPKKRQLKKTETVRERTERAASADTPKTRRLHRTGRAVSRPFAAIRRLGGKEYYLPLPDNRLGRFLNKRRSFIPRFFKEAWQELRQVEWPDKKQTFKLTMAVFIFSVIFGAIITVVDYGLGKVFRKVFIE